MLAFVTAIGLSFAFVDTTAEDYYATGFIQIGSSWYQVDVDCNEPGNTCLARISGETPVYTVYSAPNTSSAPLQSATPGIKVIPDPR